MITCCFHERGKLCQEPAVGEIVGERDHRSWPLCAKHMSLEYITPETRATLRHWRKPRS